MPGGTAQMTTAQLKQLIDEATAERAAAEPGPDASREYRWAAYTVINRCNALIHSARVALRKKRARRGDSRAAAIERCRIAWNERHSIRLGVDGSDACDAVMPAKPEGSDYEEMDEMPNCFQLIKNGKAVDLQAVDEELCQHFGEEVHPVRYFEAWYDCIGSLLAAGRSFDEVRAVYKEIPRLVEVADYLEKNFTVRSWHERKGYEKSC